MGSITTRSYPGGDEQVTTGDLDEVSDLLAEGDADVVWVDIDDPSKADLVRLAEELGLHHLAVEDALDPHQRDKYVHYEHHVFLVAHAVTLDVDAAELRTRRARRVHRRPVDGHLPPGPAELIERVVQRWDKARRFAGCHIGVAVYALLDVIVDGYFETIDRFEAFYDEAADQVFGEHPIEPSRAPPLVRDASRAEPVRPHRPAAHGGAVDGRRPGPRALRAAGRAVPARRRGRADAGLGRGRVAARAGRPPRRRQPRAARLPAEPGDEEGDELGRDHRRADARHRLLRHERAVPGVRGDVGGRRRRRRSRSDAPGALYVLFRRRSWL